MNTQNKSLSPHTATEVLEISSNQATELGAIPSEQNAQQRDCWPHSSSDSSSTPLVKQSTLATLKPSNMGNVMVILSNLPGVVSGDEFWMEAATYLESSKPAREFISCDAICPELRIKWLRRQVRNLKK